MNKPVSAIFIGICGLILLNACGNKEIEKEDTNQIISEETISETLEDTIIEDPGMDTEIIVAGNDFDPVLDDYEEYVDEYIVFYKKAMAGDESALAEYTSMLEKAQELQTSLETSSNEMTAKQASRMLKIQQKLINAMSN